METNKNIPTRKIGEATRWGCVHLNLEVYKGWKELQGVDKLGKDHSRVEKKLLEGRREAGGGNEGSVEQF